MSDQHGGDLDQVRQGLRMAAPPDPDKLAHFLAFAGLAFLLWRTRWISGAWPFAAVLLGWTVLDEASQALPVLERSTSWQEPLWVTVYPIDADGSSRTSRYLGGLTADNFMAIESFMESETARYGVGIERPLRIDVGRTVVGLPPPAPQSGNPFTAAWWGLKIRWWARSADPNDPRIEWIVLSGDGVEDLADEAPLGELVPFAAGKIDVVDSGDAPAWDLDPGAIRVAQPVPELLQRRPGIPQHAVQHARVVAELRGEALVGCTFRLDDRQCAPVQRPGVAVASALELEPSERVQGLGEIGVGAPEDLGADRQGLLERVSGFVVAAEF